MHDPKISFRCTNDEVVEHFLNRNTSITNMEQENQYKIVDYYEFMNNLLQFAYKTNCINYNNFGFESKSDCYE